MAIGIGGINYNLQLGDKIFGWANGDRATVGVAAEGLGEGGFATAWLHHTGIGNEVKVLTGSAKGEKGVIVGKFSNMVLLHFDAAALDKLAIGDTIQAKARSTGLAINGFDDVHPHGVDPMLIEKMGIRNIDGKLEVPVVMEIPGELAGQGSGGSSLSGHWHVQTCYPPDIKKHHLDELRFGDLVLLKDIQTDYGKGFYRGRRHPGRGRERTERYFGTGYRRDPDSVHAVRQIDALGSSPPPMLALSRHRTARATSANHFKHTEDQQGQADYDRRPGRRAARPEWWIFNNL